MRTILFRCDANADTGFGHLIRCVNLAKNFGQNQLAKISFVGIYNAFASEILSANNFEQVDISTPLDIDYLCLQDSPKSLIIIDSYAVDNDYIRQLAKLQAKKIYFDDGISRLDYEEKADALISLRIDRPLSDFPKAIKLYSGLSYFIAAPEMHQLREKNLSKLAEHHIQGISKILIFISGKEEGRAIEKKLLLALDSLGIALKVSIIAAHNLYSEFHFSNIELTILEPSNQMHLYLASADAVISGGGLLKYEAAYCAIPGAIYSLTELQQEDTDSFCRMGLAYDLKTDKNALEAQLFHFISDRTIQQSIRQQAQLLFKSYCTQALAKDLLTFI